MSLNLIVKNMLPPLMVQVVETHGNHTALVRDISHGYDFGAHWDKLKLTAFTSSDRKRSVYASIHKQHWLEAHLDEDRQLDNSRRFKGVTYLSSDGRASYEATAKDGRLINTQSGNLIDTIENDYSDIDITLWGLCAHAYILSPDNRLYIGKHELDKFHHSSFLAGRPVKDAGNIVISRGQVLAIINKSGHYLPNKEQKLHTLQWMASRDLDLQDAFIHSNILDNRLYFANDFLRKHGLAKPIENPSGYDHLGITKFKIKRAAQLPKNTTINRPSANSPSNMTLLEKQVKAFLL